MYTYKGYLNDQVHAIDLHESEELLDVIYSEMDMNDIDIKEIWEELITNIAEYAQLRCKWLAMSKEDRAQMDKIRTMRHDSVIGSFNCLDRFIRKVKPDSTWRADLGDDRRRIGDFAMYIAYVYGINGR